MPEFEPPLGEPSTVSDDSKPSPAVLVEQALRDHMRLKVTRTTIERAQCGWPIHLSGGEAEDAARIVLDALAGAGMVVVPAEDLDIVMNQGDRQAGWTDYSTACERLRAALPVETES